MLKFKIFWGLCPLVPHQGSALEPAGGLAVPSDPQLQRSWVQNSVIFWAGTAPVCDNLSAMRASLDNVWSEVKPMKSHLWCQQKEIETCQSSAAVLDA